eukprot:1152251-Pelagomonas_calceolata.AAC.2
MEAAQCWQPFYSQCNTWICLVLKSVNASPLINNKYLDIQPIHIGIYCPLTDSKKSAEPNDAGISNTILCRAEFAAIAAADAPSSPPDPHFSVALCWRGLGSSQPICLLLFN